MATRKSFCEQNKFKKPRGLRKGVLVYTDYYGIPRKIYIVTRVFKAPEYESGYAVKTEAVGDNSNYGYTIDSSWFKVLPL